MKNKKNLLYISIILELIYTLIMGGYYIYLNKFNDEVIANLFLLAINLFFTFILYIESKKDVEYLKNNRSKLIISGIWMLCNNVVPGVLVLYFVSSLKENKITIPEVKKEKISTFNKFKSLLVIISFLTIYLLLPTFKFFDKIPKYLIYIFIFISLIIIYFKDLKKDFILYKNNFKNYIKFIFKRYFIMLGLMILISIPVLIFNKGNASGNQQGLNEMFKKMPFIMLILSTLYAPFVEETVFRLSFSKVINNDKLFIMISGLLFGLLHVIGNFSTLPEFLYILVYSSLGMCLAKAYRDSNNIFVSISMHFIQNFISSILIILLYFVIV